MNQQRPITSNNGVFEITEPPILPPSWIKTILEKIVDPTRPICYGILMPKENLADGVLYVKVRDFKGDRIDLLSLHRTSKEIANQYRRSALRGGDVLVSIRGTFGRVAEVPVELEGGNITQDTARVAVQPNLNPTFVAFWLRSPECQRYFKQVARGVAVRGVNIRDLKLCPIPLAPLNEQRRIVAKIEELFSDLDAAVAALERAKANLKRYRAAVLKTAVEGKLTENWRAEHPNTEPASKLLERILIERRQKWEADQLAKFESSGKTPPKNWREKYVEPKPPDTKGLPELPKGWCWVSWEHVLAFEEGAFKRGPFGSALTKSIFVPHGYKVYEQYCPINDDCSFARYYITADKFREMESFAVHAGDYLISCSGVTLGRITQVPEVFEQGIINQALLRVRIDSNIIRHHYFIRLFRSPFFQRLIFENSTGSAIPNVKGVKELKAIPLPLPPLIEQDQLVVEIDEKLSQIEATEASIKQVILRATYLRHSILKQAFEGKLVSQDRNDEPANVLLEKINTGHSVSLNGISHNKSTRPNQDYNVTKQRRKKTQE